MRGGGAEEGGAEEGGAEEGGAEEGGAPRGPMLGDYLATVPPLTSAHTVFFCFSVVSERQPLS
jgi:hypothetical protein